MLESVWIVVEQRDGVPLPAVLELVTAARGFAANVSGFVWGKDAAGVVTACAEHGMSRLIDLGDLEGSLPGPRVAAAIAAAVRSDGAPSAIFVPTTYDGRDIAARLSVKLDLPAITNVVGLTCDGDGFVAEHAIFGGTEIARSQFVGANPGIFVIRPKSFVADPVGGSSAIVESAEAPAGGASDGAKIVDRHVEHRSGPSLDDATIIVSGGRGLGSKDNFAFVEQLADLLQGAPGASRAIVDAGWVPYSYQIGQTGKTVKPDIYIACGISGATQHLVGMKGARHIIAINTDVAAPIFAIADLGVVADVTTLLPRLVKLIESRA